MLESDVKPQEKYTNIFNKDKNSVEHQSKDIQSKEIQSKVKRYGVKKYRVK